MNSLKRNINTNVIVVLVIVFSFLLVQLVNAVAATPAAPGSDGDPIVTKSYVDKEIKALKTTVNSLSTKLADLTNNNDDLSKRIEDLSTFVKLQETKISNLTASVDKLNKQISSPNQKQVFNSIKVKAGKRLLSGASTQIILRQGKATSISSKAGGLSDLTIGKDLTTGVSISENHLILVPLDDGRGFKAVTDVWILICGKYTIV